MNEENKKLLEEITKRFDEKTEETRRHFDVAVEDIKSQLEAFGDGQKNLERKFDSLETKVNSLETKVDSLVEDMDYVKTTLTDNKERFKETADKRVVDDHEKRLMKLENTVLART